MTDLSRFIAPKSDQLNADDLLAGPRTITITKVSAAPDSAEQPINVFFEGDNGKPYKPCKSMRRVMVAAWKADGSKYAGRRMTLFRDPEVMFGGLNVGGIRISHMSHIDAELALALTATRGAKKAYKVKPLRDEAPRQERPSQDARPARANDLAGKMITALRGASTLADLAEVLEDPRFKRDYQRLGPDDAERVDLEADNRRAELKPLADDADESEDRGYGEAQDRATAP